jgi:hypothetical protein
MISLNTPRRRAWLLLIGLLAILALLLWLSPAEQTLGQKVKLVYLHGALVRTAMVLFGISLPVNLAALIGGRIRWSIWGRALAWAAIGLWLAHAFVSMVTTFAAWGVIVAWFEPRTRFTFTLAGVGVLFLVMTHLVGDVRFSALAFALLAGLAWGLAPGLGVVQHPLDPIGSSASSAIRFFYMAILAVSLAIGGLLAAWLHAKFESTLLRH